MAAEDHSKAFPDIDSKLSAPLALNAFLKDKQAREAKQQRAKIEDAEALKRFEAEFGDSEDDNDVNTSGPRSTYNHSSNGARGYGSARGGPGSLGPLHGQPPPPSLKRKRLMEEAREAEAARREEEWYTDDKTKNDRDTGESIEETGDIAPKSTLQLSCLPPGTSEETIMNLLQPYVEVYSVEITHASGVKRTDTAVATLEHVVKQSAIDAAVSTLRDKYLGGGYFLSIARHLSSAALRPNIHLGAIGTSDEPFGAKKPKTATGSGNLRNAPPPSHFAPPGSLEVRNSSAMHVERTVPVSTSMEVGTLKAINVVSDRLLSEQDPGRALQIESLLMKDPSVVMDERFAFLYDSHSPAGVYYRYLLWSDRSKNTTRGHSDQSEARIFHDVQYGWPSPHPRLPFPDVMRLGDVMESSDYNSDEEESDDEDEERKFNSGIREGAQAMSTDEQQHLTPSQQARLAWLLSQIPTTHTMLRSIEVANITNFAIAHASAGAEKIVDILTLNVQKPFSSTLQATSERLEVSSDEEFYNNRVVGFEAQFSADGPVGNMKRDSDDPSHAKLIGLYIINDILLNAVTAGAKGAWKYRQLFEAGFLAKKTFDYLGQLDKELSWGRLRAEQWKNKVTFLLDAWEKQNVFKDEVHKELRKTFLGQSGDDRGDSTNSSEGSKTSKPLTPLKAPSMSRFKKVDGTKTSHSIPGSHSSASVSSALPRQRRDADHGMPDAHKADSTPAGGSDDTPMTGLAGTPATGLKDTPTGSTGPNSDSGAVDTQKNVNKGFSMSMKVVKGKQDDSGGKAGSADSKRRMRAEDMFADSDEE